jgi:hypothetical protein
MEITEAGPDREECDQIEGEAGRIVCKYADLVHRSRLVPFKRFEALTITYKATR